MLYVTTRDEQEVYTAYRALHESRSGNGGLYLPFKAPDFSPEELDGLLSNSFHKCVAEVLNLLFPVKLTGVDVEFAIGRKSVLLKSLGRRAIMAESWHNPEGEYAYLENRLTRLMLQEDSAPGNWVRIAIRTAVWFGLFAELRQAGFTEKMDVSVVSGDFAAPISAWYAKQWGLPIGRIICCCNENSALWELFRYGQMRTDTVSVPTATPEADITTPTDLERLIYASGGAIETRRYLEAVRLGRPYRAPEELLKGQGMYVSVISGQRMMQTIPSVYRTHGHLLSPYGALAYAGLLDYRAIADAPRNGLVLEERSPLRDESTVAEALGVDAKSVKDYL